MEGGRSTFKRIVEIHEKSNTKETCVASGLVTLAPLSKPNLRSAIETRVRTMIPHLSKLLGDRP